MLLYFLLVILLTYSSPHQVGVPCSFHLVHGSLTVISIKWHSYDGGFYSIYWAKWIPVFYGIFTTFYYSASSFMKFWSTHETLSWRSCYSSHLFFIWNTLPHFLHYGLNQEGIHYQLSWLQIDELMRLIFFLVLRS